MQDLIPIDSKPAVIIYDHEAAKKLVQNKLEPYKTVVTVDTVKSAKTDAAEIKKFKKSISDSIREAIAEASGPVKIADEQRKELVKMCDEGYAYIRDQIKKFEDETRDKAKQVLTEYRLELWEEQSIQNEFRKAECEDLAIVTALTGKGNLAASARNKLEARVTEDKHLQDQTERRLLKLEIQSLKAGLKAPLTRDHVNSFLFRDDDSYQAELDRIIASEIKRQEIAEAATREQLAKEQSAKEQAAQCAADAEPAKEPEVAHQPGVGRENQENPAEAPRNLDEPLEETEPEQKPKARTLVPCTVTCTFSVDVPHNMPTHLIESQISERLHAAGFQSLQKVVAEINLNSIAA